MKKRCPACAWRVPGALTLPFLLRYLTLWSYSLLLAQLNHVAFAFRLGQVRSEVNQGASIIGQSFLIGPEVWLLLASVALPYTLAQVCAQISAKIQIDRREHSPAQ